MYVTFTATVISNQSTSTWKSQCYRERFSCTLTQSCAIQFVVTLFRVYPVIEKVQASQTLSSLLTVCAIEVEFKVKWILVGKTNQFLVKISIFLESICERLDENNTLSYNVTQSCTTFLTSTICIFLSQMKFYF